MKQISTETFEKEILEATTPCVVVFKNEGCHLCQGLDKVIPRVERRVGKGANFYAVDSYEEKHLVNLLEIDGVPTIFLFINGDGREIPYPENPNPFSGYSEEYLTTHLERAVANVRDH